MIKNFRPLIRKILDKTGWSLRRLADELNITAPAVQNLRDNKIDPKYSTGVRILELARQLGILND